MEGLIPLVIHAIKKRRHRNSYLYLSTTARFQALDPPEEELVALPIAQSESVQESRRCWSHRRTQSELPQTSEPDRRIIAPSRSLRHWEASKPVVFFPRSTDSPPLTEATPPIAVPPVAAAATAYCFRRLLLRPGSHVLLDFMSQRVQ